MVKRHIWLAGSLALALVLVAATAPGHAQSSPRQTTFLTFAQAVMLPRVTLPPGTYAFELAHPWSDRHTVVVRSGDGQRLYYLGITRLVPRPLSLREASGVLLGERRAGQPPPITVWYPPHESDGRQFLYP